MANQNTFEINAEARTIGKHHSRGLRRSKQVPAIIYGPKIDNLNVSIFELEAVKYAKSEYDNTIFTLKSSDKKINELKVLKKSSSVHPVTRRPLHIDFYAVDMASKVRVFVEIKFMGKPLGASEGGLAQEVRREVEVECLPADIPKYLEINVESVGLNDVLHVSDLTISEKLRLITSKEEALYTVNLPKEEEVVTPVAAAADAAVAGAAPAAGAPAAPGAAPAAAAAPAKADAKKPEKK